MAAPRYLYLTARAATRAIRERAAVTENVILTEHAMDRMVERDISAPEVFTILRRGTVHAAPALTEEGEWKAEIEMRLPGSGNAAVVTVFRDGDRLVVVTVMWRDMR